ncbi:hypothetical protein CDL12_29398 [Handroanthus impetiginosus]|uniref:UspA domain-containing protein n=1 Tax=Handroanthus impetiginosus TaxID=429701 RepID=A0A2G9FZ07_9LAMI|nr:hypothetical protein CDL12_29398 [Handroanthus impetiginosus]
MVAINDSGESLYALEWVLYTFLVLSGNYYNHDDQSMLTIIHVMEPFPYYAFPGAHAVFSSTSMVQSMSNKVQEESALAMLAHALHMCTQRMVRAKTSILEGDPKEMICQVAELMHVNLIVVGSRGLGKIKKGKAFMGNVSKYEVHHAKCLVLILKPPTSAPSK